MFDAGVQALVEDSLRVGEEARVALQALRQKYSAAHHAPLMALANSTKDPAVRQKVSQPVMLRPQHGPDMGGSASVGVPPGILLGCRSHAAAGLQMGWQKVCMQSAGGRSCSAGIAQGAQSARGAGQHSCSVAESCVGQLACMLWGTSHPSDIQTGSNSVEIIMY